MRIEDIKKDMQKKLNSTIKEVSTESLHIMQNELNNFYAGGIPQYYKRTGTLGSSPEVKDMYATVNEAGVTVGLDQSIGYSTGTFSGAEVIDAAEYGRSGIVGHGGFWRRSEAEIKNAVDNAIRRNF